MKTKRPPAPPPQPNSAPGQKYLNTGWPLCALQLRQFFHPFSFSFSLSLSLCLTQTHTHKGLLVNPCSLLTACFRHNCVTLWVHSAYSHICWAVLPRSHSVSATINTATLSSHRRLCCEPPPSPGRHRVVRVTSNSISVIHASCSNTCLSPKPPHPSPKASQQRHPLLPGLHTHLWGFLLELIMQNHSLNLICFEMCWNPLLL